MKTKSIRLKINALFLSFLAVILVFFSLFPIYSIQNILKKEQQGDLSNKAQQIVNYLNLYSALSTKGGTPRQLFSQLFTNQNSSSKQQLAELLKDDIKSLGLSKDVYRVVNENGNEVLRSNNCTPEVQRKFNRKLAKFAGPDFFYMRVNGQLYYGINYPFLLSVWNPLTLQLAIPIAYVQNILGNIIISFLEGILVILVVGIFMSNYLTRQILKPVEEITKTANNISQNNLNSRIHIKNYEKEMKDLIDAFNHMISRLESSFSYIKEFNSMVSHELKTPLAIIKGELEMALEAEHSKESSKKIMQDVLDEVYRLTKTIKDMLLLAEYEYKLGVLKMEKMDIGLLLREIFHHCEVLANDKNISLQMRQTHKPIWIEGDAVHLRRVFLNLINNAVKFTPEGGEIKMSTQVHDDHVAISIKDTGIGIPSENQSRIFEKFYRGGAAKHHGPEGSGLGLSIARAITQAHKGAISFESVVNKGTTFKVSLPLSH